MYEAPGREALIRTALESFQTEILPELAGDKKYVGLMIASALAIAAREFDADRDGTAPQRVLDGFAELYGEDNVARAGLDTTARLDSLSRHLAKDIRDGLYDGDFCAPVLLDILTLITEEKLKLSNPKFLAQREYSQPTPN